MEYNLPSEIVKDLNFGDQAKTRIIAGVDKLAEAVKSTLGASGKCVIYEDARGKPVITKDGDWHDVTRRETIEGAEAAIDGSIDHFSKKLEATKGPKVIKTFE